MNKIDKIRNIITRTTWSIVMILNISFKHLGCIFQQHIWIGLSIKHIAGTFQQHIWMTKWRAQKQNNIKTNEAHTGMAPLWYFLIMHELYWVYSECRYNKMPPQLPQFAESNRRFSFDKAEYSKLLHSEDKNIRPLPQHRWLLPFNLVIVLRGSRQNYSTMTC